MKYDMMSLMEVVFRSYFTYLLPLNIQRKYFLKKYSQELNGHTDLIYNLQMLQITLNKQILYFEYMHKLYHGI